MWLFYSDLEVLKSKMNAKMLLDSQTLSSPVLLGGLWDTSGAVEICGFIRRVEIHTSSYCNLCQQIMIRMNMYDGMIHIQTAYLQTPVPSIAVAEAP